MINYHHYLGKRVQITIDRPLGTQHPKHSYTYPINYGFIPNTLAEDGDEIDVYLIDAQCALQEAEATIIAVVNRKDDDENKLVASLDGTCPSEKEIRAKINFQEQFFDSTIEFN